MLLMGYAPVPGGDIRPCHGGPSAVVASAADRRTPRSTRMRALIVGGGPAGTTAAIALGHVGIEALVIEREDGARPVGVGLALQNSPLRALHQLGLLDPVVERGYWHEAVNICAPDGTVVHRIVTEPLVPGTPSFVAISRVALAGILADALVATPGAEIRYGTSPTALRDRGDAV